MGGVLAIILGLTRFSLILIVIRESFNLATVTRMPMTLTNRQCSVSHTKASLIGSTVSVPITNGQLNLGTWQGE